MGRRRGENSWLIRVGNRLRAVRDMPPIQRGRPAEDIIMGSMSSRVERLEESRAMFGRGIEEAVDSDGVSKFVRWCVAAILDTGEGLDTDALYRASGGQGELRRIQDQPEHGMREVLNEEMNVHVLTGALKLFFRSLKRPILRIEEFQDVLEGDHQKLSQVIASQTRAESSTLAFFFQHLQEVLQHPDNHMDARALGVVFGPTLMRMRNSDVTNMAAEMAAQSRLFELLLDLSDNVFSTSLFTPKSSDTSTPPIVESRTANKYDIPSSEDEVTLRKEMKDCWSNIASTANAQVSCSEDENAHSKDNTASNLKDHVTLKESGQKTSDGESPSSDLSDDDDDDNGDDDWKHQEAAAVTSASRHEATRLSTIATSIRVNVPTAL